MIDPKSELSRICLRMTPPDCGKRVWFLDLGRPAFGMSPLRLIGDRPLAIEAAQIAENVVAALLDINENQIYQILPPLPLPRRHRRHRDGQQAGPPRPPGGRLYAAAAGEGGLPERCGGGLRGPARPRPDRGVLPLRATGRPADGHQPRRRTPRRAPQQDLRALPAYRRCAGSSTTPATCHCERSSRPETS